MLHVSLIHRLKYCVAPWSTVLQHTVLQQYVIIVILLYCFATASNTVLQQLEEMRNNILRTTTYNNFRCHITLL